MKFSFRNFFSFMSARKHPLDLQSRGFSMFNSILVNEDTAMKVSSFHRGIIYLSTQLAKLPWEIKDRDNRVLADNDIFYLLNVMPNPEMNAFSFRCTMIYQAIIHGNFYAEIERAPLSGRIVNLWPLPNHLVTPLRDTAGNLRYRVAGGSEKGTDVYLNPEDVFHIKNLFTKDGHVGQGLAAYAVDVLRISIGADNMAGGLFANSGIPSGVITVKGRLTTESADRLKESWVKANSGRRVGGVAVFEEGTEFKPVVMSPDIMQFLDSRKFGVVEIARFLGVPPTKLFDMSASTYNNTENANLEVATDTLHAWERNLSTEVDVKLLSRRHSDRKAQMDLYEIFKGDMASRAEYFTKMLAAGSITPNQIRKKEGEAPYVGGDDYYIAGNNLVPVKKVNDVIDAQIKKASDPKQVAPTEKEKEQKKAELVAWMQDILKR